REPRGAGGVVGLEAARLAFGLRAEAEEAVLDGVVVELGHDEEELGAVGAELGNPVERGEDPRDRVVTAQGVDVEDDGDPAAVHPVHQSMRKSLSKRALARIRRTKDVRVRILTSAPVPWAHSRRRSSIPSAELSM